MSEIVCLEELLGRACQVGWQFRGKVEQLPRDADVPAYEDLLAKRGTALARLAEAARQLDGVPLIDVMDEIWAAW